MNCGTQIKRFLQGSFQFKKAYIRKEDKSKINGITAQIRKLGKEKQNKS